MEWSPLRAGNFASRERLCAWLSVAMEALHRLGIANPAQHFIVVADGPLNEDGIPVAGAGEKVCLYCRGRSLLSRQHLVDYPSLQILYRAIRCSSSNPFADLIASNDPHGFAREYAYNVSPVSDNAPFFFFTLKTDQIFTT